MKIIRLTESEIAEVIRHAAAMWRYVVKGPTRMSDEERVKAAKTIDVTNAWAWSQFVEVLEPYGEREVAVEHSCIGRHTFICDPVEQVPVVERTVREANRGVGDDDWKRLLAQAFARRKGYVDGTTRRGSP